jgi:hypothetical protein
MALAILANMGVQGPLVGAYLLPIMHSVGWPGMAKIDVGDALKTWKTHTSQLTEIATRCMAKKEWSEFRRISETPSSPMHSSCFKLDL